MANNIDSLNNSLYFSAVAQQAANAKNKDDLKKKESVSKKKFSDILSKEEDDIAFDASMPPEIRNMPPDKALQYLLDNVYMSGDMLKKSQHPSSILAYKNSVKNFMNFIIKHSYDMEQFESSRSIKKRKKFYTIKVIDEKLEQLAAGVLYNQKAQIELLSRIDEINGLLVDLLT